MAAARPSATYAGLYSIILRYFLASCHDGFSRAASQRSPDCLILSAPVSFARRRADQTFAPIPTSPRLRKSPWQRIATFLFCSFHFMSINVYFVLIVAVSIQHL